MPGGPLIVWCPACRAELRFEQPCPYHAEAKVHRHARPVWLSPQHLDFFLPRYRFAVEYMGAQHYEPIAMFGGAQSLADTKSRDERKRTLCERMGVALVYVRHDEDIQSARDLRDAWREASDPRRTG